MIRRTIAGAVCGLAVLLVAACGGDDYGYVDPTPVPTAQPNAVAVQPTADTTKVPTELRVAFINLMSPFALDENNPVADTTFDERMDAVTEELKAFNPDIVGFNEASVTKAHGSVAARLAKDLKMELQYARANPWYPGQSKEQSDAIARQIGFEEGELILSKYPILRAERKELNPRTSEIGEGRAALHAVIKVPGTLGELDVYITHLTGGGDKVRQAQAADFMSFVKATKGGGQVIVMGGMSDPVGSPTYEVYRAAGLHDVFGKTPVTTCCRDSVLGQQAATVARTDYLMTQEWYASEYSLFGDKPKKRADGTWLYESDHNGLKAVLPISIAKAP
jgi:endonuclease/exonuclease/phosphatase family metal-dependent hydrolase